MKFVIYYLSKIERITVHKNFVRVLKPTYYDNYIQILISTYENDIIRNKSGMMFKKIIMIGIEEYVKVDYYQKVLGTLL